MIKCEKTNRILKEWAEDYKDKRDFNNEDKYKVLASCFEGKPISKNGEYLVCMEKVDLEGRKEYYQVLLESEKDKEVRSAIDKQVEEINFMLPKFNKILQS